MTRRECARRRTALDHADRVAARCLRADHSAGAQHDQRRVGEAFLREPVAQSLQIGLRDRHRIGIDGGGRCTRKFADLRRDVARQCDEEIRKQFPEAFANGPFVARIDEAVEEADRGRAHASCFQRNRDRIDLLEVGCGEHFAVGPYALGNGEGQLRRHQRLRKFDLRIIHFVTVLVADAQDVAKSLRHEQRGRRPLALDQGIGDDCRGVHDHAIDLPRPQPRALEHGMNAGEETFDQVAWAW